MAIATFQSSILRKIGQFLELLLRRPPRMQLAALCYREGGHEPEVLLVTSRNTKRLIIPKGWPMANHSSRKTAKKEAFEEAGVIGKVGKEPLGEFLSYKGMGNGFKVRTNIIVYPLKFEEQVAEFPEAGQRELLWLPLSAAADACQEDGLRDLLQSPKVKSLLIKQK